MTAFAAAKPVPNGPIVSQRRHQPWARMPLGPPEAWTGRENLDRRYPISVRPTACWRPADARLTASVLKVGNGFRLAVCGAHLDPGVETAASPIAGERRVPTEHYVGVACKESNHKYKYYTFTRCIISGFTAL